MKGMNLIGNCPETMTREEYIEYMKKSFFDQEEAEKMADYATVDFGSYIEAYKFYSENIPFTMAEALCSGDIKRKAHHVEDADEFFSDVLDEIARIKAEHSAAQAVGPSVKMCDVNVHWIDGTEAKFEGVNMVCVGSMLALDMQNGKVISIPLCNIRWFESEEL